MTIYNKDDQTTIDLLKKIVQAPKDGSYHGYIFLGNHTQFLTIDLIVQLTPEEKDLVSRLM